MTFPEFCKRSMAKSGHRDRHPAFATLPTIPWGCLSVVIARISKWEATLYVPGSGVSKIDPEVKKNSECFLLLLLFYVFWCFFFFLRRVDLLSCHLLWIKAAEGNEFGHVVWHIEPLLPGNKICVSKEIQQKGECFKSQRLSDCKSRYVQKGK